LLDRWFPPRPTAERKAYGERVAESLSSEEASLLRATFLSHLRDRTLPWETPVAFLRARRPAEGTRPQVDG
ncbi:MAG: hypothetical protein D6812_12155, partial [Deltaproteobacteria bacterium]